MTPFRSRRFPPVAWLRRHCGGVSLYPLGALAGLNLVDELDRAAYGLLGPEITRYFGISPTVLGLTYIPMIVLGVILSLAAGHVTDRYNRVKLSLVGGIVWLVFAFATGLVPAFWILIVVRMMTAVGRSVSGPAHSSLFVDYYPKSGRGVVFSVWQNCNPLGAFLGLVVGGFLATAFGWRAVFLLLPLVGIVFLVLISRLKEPTRGHYTHAEIVSESEAPAVESPEPVPFLTSIRELLRVKSWVRFAWIWLFLGAGVALYSVLPFYFAAVFGVDTSGRGLILGAGTLAQIVGTVIVGLISQRWMARGLYQRCGNVLTVSTLAVAACYIGLGVAPTLAVATTIVIVTYLLQAVAAVPLAQIFAEIMPTRIRGMGFGAIWVMWALGFWFLPLSLDLGDATSYRVSMLIAVAPMLIAAVLAVITAKHIAEDVQLAKEKNAAHLDASRRKAESAKASDRESGES